MTEGLIEPRRPELGHLRVGISPLDASARTRMLVARPDGSPGVLRSLVRRTARISVPSAHLISGVFYDGWLAMNDAIREPGRVVSMRRSR
jgi:hypothetical protein